MVKGKAVADQIPLGKHTEYVSQYTPELLFPVPREQARSDLVLPAQGLPFTGVDVWNAYEVSWLNRNGLPQVALGRFDITADSANLVESKSLKLYLNSLNQTRFDSRDEVAAVISRDLTALVAGQVTVQLLGLTDPSFTQVMAAEGLCLDSLDIGEVTCYQPDAALLQVDEQAPVTERQCYTHLLRTNCPVTSQPDWATLMIHYQGRPIVAESLLRYVVSYREYTGFHEHSVEKIFTDIMERCQPQALSLYARYTRRGGIDINPFRTNAHSSPLQAWVTRNGRQVTQ